MEKVSVIIPAFNEEARIGPTLQAIVHEPWVSEIIVVDDGSQDQTANKASEWTKKVVIIPANVGKAKAIEKGVEAASYPLLLFLDADLEESARSAQKLLEPIWSGQADMTIAIFPPAKNGGFGLIKKLATWGIYLHSGRKLLSPLCGQRAIKKEVFLSCYQGDQRFGIEVGLSLDCLKNGYKIEEIEVPFFHRETGKTFSGFIHRLKQGYFICHSLLTRR